MKTLICMLMGASLVGCSPVITGAHVDRAIEACAGHKGVAQLITPTAFGLFDLTKMYAAECVDQSAVNIGGTRYVQK